MFEQFDNLIPGKKHNAIYFTKYISKNAGKTIGGMNIRLTHFNRTKKTFNITLTLVRFGDLNFVQLI